jgi:hypothetical protein
MLRKKWANWHGQFRLALGQDTQGHIAERLGFLEPRLGHVFKLER